VRDAKLSTYDALRQVGLVPAALHSGSLSIVNATFNFVAWGSAWMNLSRTVNRDDGWAREGDSHFKI
jgi:hypothetical protein